jgi:hypothetical protein
MGYAFWMTTRWLLLTFDFLGSVAVLVATLFSISSLSGAGLAALCITSAMAFTRSGEFWSFLYHGIMDDKCLFQSVLDMSMLDQ